MLEGNNVNLKVREKEDVDFLVECFDELDFWAENSPAYEQFPRWYLMKTFDNPPDLQIVIDWRLFVIQKKDGTRIGITWHMVNQPYRMMEIGYFLIPSERGKGYGTEAAQLMVDYLFLFKNIVRIQAMTNVGNRASQRVLEKAGFKIEGTVRKLAFVRGVWTDWYLHSILREEWKEPKILRKTTSET